MNLRFLWILLLFGCSSGGGLSGCETEDGPPFVRTSTNVIENSLHTVVTSKGVDFAYENRVALVGNLLDVDPDGWASFDVPPFESGDDRFGLRARDLSIGLNIASADLDFEILPGPLRVRLDISNARMRFNDGVIGLSIIADGACRLDNGILPDTPNESFAVADVVVVLTPSISPQGNVEVRVDLEMIELSNLNISLKYDATLPECVDEECEFVCSLSILGAELTESLYSSFRDEISDILAPVMTELINERLREISDQNLKIEGRLGPESLSDSLPLPRDAHSVQFMVGPNQTGLVYVDGEGRNPGVGVAVDIGTDAVDHRCVPRVAGEPTFTVGPAPALTGIDDDGNPYDIGLSITEAMLNRFLWSTWRSGMLCLTLDSDTIEESLDRGFDTDTLGIFLPSLSILTRTPKPVMIVLDPKLTKGNFPVLDFTTIQDDQGVPQAGVQLQLYNLGIDMYAYLEDRWTRMTGVRVDVDLRMAVQATANNELALVGDAPAINNLDVEYNELLESDDLEQLLRALIDLVLGSLLTDGLNFQFGLDGLLSSLTQIPYEARINDISTAGQAYDHLNVYLSFAPIENANALSAGVDTRARLHAVARDTVELKVAAPGAVAPVYQYRLDYGPWRTLRPAQSGRLIIEEPRLAFATEQVLYVRAVDRGRYQSMDMTPAEVTVPSAAERNHPDLLPLEAHGGCASTPTFDGTSLWLSFVLILGLFRREIRPAMILVGLAFIVGCGDSDPAPDIPCVEDTECPAGLTCLGRICQPEQSCDDSSDCCVLQSCQGGVCRDAVPDVCTDGGCPTGQTCEGDYCVAVACTDDTQCSGSQRCIQGHCVLGSPCQGACGPEEACFVHRQACREAPPQCAMSCGTGSLRVVVDPRQYDGPICNLNNAVCECVEGFGDNRGSVSRQADMALLNGRPVVASFDPDFQDLVLIEGLDTESPTHTYLDGLPGSETGIINPTPSRAGLTQPGPRRGYFPQIEVDLRGRIHIAYYDGDAGQLRYLRREEDGNWIGPIVVDEAGDAGRYVQLRVDDNGQSHLVYTVLDPSGLQSSLRYALGSNASIGPQNFSIHTISSRPLNADAVVGLGLLPAEHGVKPCMTLDGDSVVVAFHDGNEGRLYLGRGGPAGFLVEPMNGLFDASLAEQDPGGRYEDFPEHRIGEDCAILSANGEIDLVFSNSRTWSLMGYRGTVQGPGSLDILDEGTWGHRARIGAAPAAVFDSAGRPVIVYQDSTNNDLRLNVRTNGGWLESAVIVNDEGAVGFSNSIVSNGSEAIIGTVRIRTVTGARERSTVELHSVDLTQY